MATHGDTCFCDGCTGSVTPDAPLTVRERAESDDATELELLNRELLASGLRPVGSLTEAARPTSVLGDNPEDIRAVRTRYAQPGQSVGNGVVRKVSPPQVALIKRLMGERDVTKLVRLPGSEDIENMSLTGARDLIDRLFGCPYLPQSAVKAREATGKQLEWLRKLTDKEATGSVAETRAAAIANEPVTFEAASAALDVLFKAPRAATVVATEAALIPGIYRKGESLIKAYLTRNSGQLVGAEWTLFEDPEATKRGLKYGEFVYGGKRMLSGLTLDMLLTLEEAKAIGAEFHYCCACGIELTHPDSIAAGIGPICASKF